MDTYYVAAISGRRAFYCMKLYATIACDVGQPQNETSPVMDARIQPSLSSYEGAPMLCGYFVPIDDSLGTLDADRRPHELHIALRLRGNEDGGRQQPNSVVALEGALTAMLEQQSGYRAAPRYPNPRAGNAVSHWCELRRVR